MGTHTPVPDLVGAIYEAALEPLGFPVALRAVCHALGLTAAGLGFHGPRSVTAQWTDAGRCQADLAAWLTGWRAAGQPLMRAVPAGAPVDGQVPLLAVLEDGPEGTITLGVWLPADDARGSDPTRALTGLLPHLRRAARLFRQASRAHADRAVASVLLDRFPRPTLLLDARAHVVRSNAAGERWLLLADGVACAEAGLVLNSAAQTERLHAAVAEHAAVCLRAERPSGLRPYGVVVTPLGEETGPAASEHAVVHVLDPEAECIPTSQLLRQLFDLTPAETRLALELAHGHSPRDAADRLGVSWNTTRTQLKAVLAKTRTDRQATLVGLMGSLATSA